MTAGKLPISELPPHILKAAAAEGWGAQATLDNSRIGRVDRLLDTYQKEGTDLWRSEGGRGFDPRESGEVKERVFPSDHLKIREAAHALLNDPNYLTQEKNNRSRSEDVKDLVEGAGRTGDPLMNYAKRSIMPAALNDAGKAIEEHNGSINKVADQHHLTDDDKEILKKALGSTVEETPQPQPAKKAGRSI